MEKEVSTSSPKTAAEEHQQAAPHHVKRMPKRLEELFNYHHFVRSLYLFLTGLALIVAFFIVQNLASVRDYWQDIVSISTPFIWGICIAYVLMPLLNYIEAKLSKIAFLHKHTSILRGISIGITMGIMTVLLTIFFWLVIPEILASLVSLFNILTSAESYAWVVQLGDELLARLKDMGITSITMNDVPDKLRDQFNSPREYIMSMLDYTQNIFSVASSAAKNILVALIVSVYLMIGKETFLAQTRKILFAFCAHDRVEHFLDFCSRTNRIFSGFISGKLLDSLIIGILCYIAMKLLALDYSMLISLIVGVTNVIPFFGPFIGAIPSILLLLIVSPKQAFIFAIMVLILQQFDGNILGPKILGGATGLTAFWVIFAVIIMGGTLGIVGMFVGVPIFATIYMVTKNVVEARLKKKEMPVETDSYK